MGSLVTLIEVGAGLLLPVIGLLGVLFSRKSKDANAARAEGRITEAILVANARYRHAVRLLAAEEGWDQHPRWPPLPDELTAGFLQAQPKPADVPDDLAAIADLARGMHRK